MTDAPDPRDLIPEAEKVMALPSIYGLFDEDGMLRYIGKANNPMARLKSHMRDSRTKRTPLYNWIRKNGEPEMRVLVSDCEDWEATERELIQIARDEGIPLLNVADGGAQPYQSKEQRQRNGLATIAKLVAGTAPIKPATREDTIKDGYNFLRYYGRKSGDKAMLDRICGKMRALYKEDPAAYRCWANI